MTAQAEHVVTATFKSFRIEVKLKRVEANKAAMANRAKKQRILEIISNKQDEALSAKSLEELNVMVAEL